MTRKAGRRTSIWVKGPDGKGRSVSFTYHSAREKQEKIAELRRMERDGISLSASTKIGYWSQKWLTNTKEINGLCDGTIGYYRSAVNLLDSRYKDMEFKSINLDDFQAYINSLAKRNPHTGRPTSRKTLLLVRSVGKAVALYASGSKVDGVSAFYDVVIPNTAPVKKRLALTEEQIKWVEEFEHPGQLLAMIACFAGLRRGELLGLEWGDVNLSKGTIQVVRSVVFEHNNRPTVKQGGKTRNATRVIAVPPVLVDYLRDYKKRLPAFPAPGAIVCCNKDGEHMTQHQFAGLWKRYMQALNREYGDFDKCNIDGIADSKLPMKIDVFTLHQCRHFFATLCYLENLSVGDSMAQLGHGDVEMTMSVYTDMQTYRKPTLSKDFQKRLNTDYHIEMSAS